MNHQLFSLIHRFQCANDYSKSNDPRCCWDINLWSRCGEWEKPKVKLKFPSDLTFYGFKSVFVHDNLSHFEALAWAIGDKRRGFGDATIKFLATSSPMDFVVGVIFNGAHPINEDWEWLLCSAGHIGWSRNAIKIKPFNSTVRSNKTWPQNKF